MKNLFIAVAIAALLASCQAQQSGGSDQPVSDASSAATPSPSEAETQEPAAIADIQLAPPVNGAFQTALPMGVVLTQPHKARMDVAVTNDSGRRGRRTEFAFLQGDAVQAMRSFAESMTAAGFQSEESTNDSGIVRQVFTRAGYGTVFARAEGVDSDSLKDPEAKGFLVAAWPSDTANDSSGAADGK